MSDQANKRRVRDAYEAFSRRDLGPFMDAIADDVDWIDPLPPDHPVGGVFRGKNEVARYFEELGKLATFKAFDVVDIVAEGDTVVAFLHLETTMRHNGRDFVGDSAHVWTFADGVAIRYRIFADTARIMAAFRGD
ncbi:MAG: nuclear transport factor 2 family protein [Candidatus Dormibacteraeota bacterium]|uniref:Nuclear transport factor 2 family protein n=1 Tax=Candidatus Dormiibacter inghamiae TaxID=3127013 RepID=A0A934ND33_9BACT|nr:nuclear transport factor 2 family protein [Candidatus Dormibacteraeota bacterium]MBJ7607120.1 nuclear transport factor 2 family protein [Candidatus Dormibacteraeota bacterium]